MLRISLVSIALLCSSWAFAERPLAYQVTITNITKGQSFTPTIVAVHDQSVSVFQTGSQASLPLEILAEAGSTGALMDDLLSRGQHVSDVAQSAFCD